MNSTINFILEECAKWIVEYLPTFFTALSGMLIAFFMGIYDGKSWWKIISSTCICGVFTLAVCSSLEHLGLPDSAATLVGGIIGFSGVERIRNVITGILYKRFGADDDENKR